MKQITKTITLFLLLAATCLENVQAQMMVNIPDANFKAALVANTSINTNGDNEIQISEAESAMFINVEESSISDLSGIEAFVNITFLNCTGNNLTSLDVSKNMALTYLNCTNNQLISLDISKNMALTSLHCANNRLINLDVSKNIFLTDLGCSNNQLISLDVSKNTALTGLYCSDNQLTSLDVSKNTALTGLYCLSNHLTSLDVSKNTALISLTCSHLTGLDVSNNTALIYLQCYDTQLTSLDISKNTALTFLNCFNSKLTSLDVSKNTALTDLYCHANHLTSLDVSKNTALTGLVCSYNQLINIDVSKNTSLVKLYCNNNNLTSLDLSKNTNLPIVWAHNNPNLTTICVASSQNRANWTKDETATYITTCDVVNIPDANFKAALLANTSINTNGDNEIQVSEAEAYTGAINVESKNISDLTGIEAFVKITSLDCDYNGLTSLDVSKNIALTSLTCWTNQLTSLNVSKNTALTSLDCTYNPLASLDVSKNISLIYLVCEYNSLTSLDVSKNTNLNYLHCPYNSLTSLDLSNNPYLGYLHCSSNRLTSIDVSKNTGLVYLDCSYNRLTSLDVSKNTNLGEMMHLRFACNNNPLTTICVASSQNRANWSKDETASYVVCHEPTTCAWNGSAWSNGTPTTITDITIDGVYNAAIHGSLTVRDITIHANGHMNISAGSVSARNITIKNNGSLNHTASNLTLSGSATVERTGKSSASTYNYWSSPIANGALPGTNRYAYVETTRTTSDYQSGWASCGTTMTQGKGYATTGGGSTHFVGNLNSGNIAVQMTHSNIGTVVDNGWNLLGNPYPSEINLASFFAANSVTGNAAYLWNGANYVTLNSGSIPSCQGFFVQTTSTKSAHFTDAMRQNGSQSLFRTEAESAKVLLKMEGAGHTDQTQIELRTEATDGYDQAFDAFKLKGNTDLQLYSKIAGSPYNYAINILGEGSKTIPLMYDAKVAGAYTISAAELTGLPLDATVVLSDMLTGAKQNLANGAYTFQSGTTSEAQRFNLLIGKAIVTSMDEASNDESATIFAYSNTVYAAKAGAFELSIYNINGVLVSKMSAKDKLSIPMAQSGLYVVKLTSDNITRTHKVIIVE